MSLIRSQNSFYLQRTNSVSTYISNLKVLPHEQIKRGGGVTSDRANATAAVTQETQAQVGTKLCILFKQHLWELHTKTHSFTLYTRRWV